MRAVLFDVDGVLLDSYAGYREVWSRWCAMRDVDLELTWAATHGRRPVETVAEVAPHLTPDEEYVVLRRLLDEVGDRFPAFEAAAPLLHSLPPNSWAVVTSGQRPTVLARFGAQGLPQPSVFVDGDDVAEGKPSPEGYLTAARLLGVRPTNCLVVEDAPAGVRAGKAAGMTVLAIASTHRADELSDADEVVPSLAQAGSHVRDWLEGEPLANNRHDRGVRSTHDAVTGVVEVWHSEQGWGVLRTPGGLSVFCHFSHVEMQGYRELIVGEAVHFDYVIPGQDGCDAAVLTRACPAGGTSVSQVPSTPPSEEPGPYSSRLTITFDDER